MNEWQAAAEKALTALWGVDVSCTITDTFRDKGRNRVYRLAVTGGPVTSVILKACLGDEENPYVLGDDAPWRAFRRFCNEWTGCAMLAPLGLGPTAYTGDAERGFYVMEDLGAGETLADKLTGDDPVAATAALLAYAHTLGELHAATQGQEAHWNELRRARGGTIFPEADSWRNEGAGFRGVCERHGLMLPTGFDADLMRISDAVDHPGDYRVFTPADCCPDNHYLRDDRVIFFDCEGATIRHALLDTAYFLAPFPTCWCTSRLPDGMPERLLTTYCQHFTGGPDFDEQLTLALAAWVLPTLTWKRAGDWEKEDHKWGLVTLRQRHLYRLENLLARPNLTTLLPCLAGVTEKLYGVLKARWTDLEPIPLYSAFRRER